jgi:hypothetical protein
MKITNGTSGAIVASLLLLLSSGDNNEVAARQGQPEEPEQESPSPRKASKAKMNLRHHNRELRRGRSRSSPFPKNNNYDSYDNREEEVPEAAVPPTPYVRRVLVPQQEQILPYHSTFP